jgi:Leucine-rich repeat (LRR) protein
VLANNSALCADPATWAVLWALPALEDLDVSGAGATALPAPPAGGAWPALRRLAAARNDLSRAGDAGAGAGACACAGGALEGLRAMPALRALHLGGCRLSAVDAHDFESLGALTALDLSDNELVHLPAGLLPAAPALAELDLSGNIFPSVPRELGPGPGPATAPPAPAPAPAAGAPAPARAHGALRVLRMDRCTYLEAAASLGWLRAALPNLQELRVAKGGAGAYQRSSQRWLEELAGEYAAAGAPGVVRW